jgi:hypothetical protein
VKDILHRFQNSDRGNRSAGSTRQHCFASGWQLLFILILLGGLPAGAAAQFAPTLSTSFDNLEAGLPSGFTQTAFFAEGQEGPASLVVNFDRGSFSFSGYSAGQTIGGLVVDLFVPSPILTVEGLIIAEVQVISVGPNSLNANAVVTEVTGNVLPGLAFLGIPDPTGATAFNVTYTNLAGDSGAIMDVSDAGSLPLSGALGFNVPLVWNTPAILTHSPFGGDLQVETVLTSSSGLQVITQESFALTGGIAPPQPVTALNCSVAGESVELSWQNSSDYASIEISRNGSILTTVVGDATGYVDLSPEPGLNQYEVRGILLGLPSAPASCSSEVSVPLNLVSLPTLAAAPGESLALSLSASLELPTEGFSIPVSYDPTQFVVEGADLEGSDAIGAEFFLVETDGVSGLTNLFLIYDSEDLQHIPAGVDRVLCRISGRVLPAVASGTQIILGLPATAGLPPVSAVIVQNNGAGYSPSRTEGLITVNGIPAGSFLRGDANGDAAVDLADAIFTLDYLFASGVTPSCQNAADSNDDDTLNVADAVQILDALFSGGPPLPPPGNGNCLPDPTPGQLDCTLGSCP